MATPLAPEDGRRRRGGRFDLRSLRGALERSFPGRCVASFVALQGLDRSIIIASQSFTALIPLVLLVSAVLPAGSGNVVADSIVRRFGLVGDAKDAVEAVFGQAQPGSVSVVSLILLVSSGVSLTRRLQRMYLTAYGLHPQRRVRGSLYAALGLAALLAELAALYLIRNLVRALPFDWAFAMPISVAAGVILWTSVPYLLMDRRIAWQRLLPGGALAGLGVSLYGMATTLYMSRLMTAYSQRYGLFGVTVAIVGWLLCFSVVVVATTVVAAELDRAPEGWACRVRAILGGDAPPASASVGADGTEEA
jgi:membrane protein